MVQSRRILAIFLMGLGLAGCDGGDSSAPNPPAPKASATPATMPSLTDWKAPQGAAVMAPPAPIDTAPITPTTDPALVNLTLLSDAKGAIDQEDTFRACALITQIYQQLKAHNLDQAQATLDKLSLLRHLRPLPDPVRFKEIPEAVNAILSARTGQIMDENNGKSGK